ncbi:MAG: fibronectin type III domain-containing protein, partial [Thermoguttaceae bacterium]|nr:fibronectin type III domain-containing protein [Thermoguttaceae bacterium]
MQFDSIRNLFVNAVERSARKSPYESNNPPSARALVLESLESRDLLSATPLEAASVSEIALASQETTPDDALDLTALQSASEPASTVVTSLADTVDANDGVVTLREAITVYANEGDTITFAPALRGGTITLGGSEIEINKSLTIDASALRNGTDAFSGITIDADAKSRIFYVRQGSLEINSIAFTGGFMEGPSASGGAIYFNGSSLTITNSLFHNNTVNSTDSYSYGGAIYYKSSATLTVTNSTFAKNTATHSSGVRGYGSAIYFGQGARSANLYNVTICDNTAKGSSTGALFLNNSSSTLNVYNSIVCNNSGGDFHKIYNNSSVNAYNVLSDSKDWSTGLASVYAYDSSYPVFTNAEEGDYSLAQGSQAINRGNNEYVAEDVATDLAGAPRIIGGTVDLGAYEFSTGATSDTPSTVVTSLADTLDGADGVITLREAITFYANEGDTITFAPALRGGTITLAGTQIEIRNAITIDASALRNGTDGTPGVTLDANSASRIFIIPYFSPYLPGTSDSYSPKSVTIDSLAFTGGSTYSGCAIHVSSSMNLTIRNSNFYNNTATDSSNASGGAIYALSSNLTITNSNFYDNTAAAGGASGGAINFRGSSLTISNSRFHNNTVNSTSYNSYGGAICFDGTSLTISNSTFTKNTATCSSSSGSSYGSVICFLGGYRPVNLYNVTIYDNTTKGSNTGALDLSNSSSTLNVYNSIVCNNSGGDLFISKGRSAVKAYNVLSASTNWSNGTEFVYAYDSSNPLFTNAAEGDYTLAHGSQAINRGNNEYVGADLATDLAGAPRVIAGTVDLGAYEYATSAAPETPSTVVTSLANTVDPTDGVVTLREAITFYANDGDTITFAPTLKGGTINLAGAQIEIRKSLTIDASALRNGTDGTPGITLDAASQSRVFYVRRGSLEINSLAFTGGSKASGGAIYASGSTNLTITNSSFYDNAASGSSGSACGGAIYFVGASLAVSNSRFHNNTASGGSYGYGGAIYYDSSATLAVTNTTFTKNTATYRSSSSGACRGSAIYLNSGAANLYNVTIYGNTTKGADTGALYFNSSSSTLNVYNSIVAGNSGGDFFKVYDDSSVNAYSVLSDSINWSNGLASVYAYDSSNPLFANTAKDDYSLAHGSQAINRGNNEYVAEDVATDLAGAPRVIAGTVDLGAYEYATGATSDTPSTVVTSLADTLDATDGVVTLREAITFYANDGDTITFAPALRGGTITLGGSEIAINKSLTIDASALRDGTDAFSGITIDANAKSRIFYVRQGSLEINSIAFTGGFTGGSNASGGAIYFIGSSLTITNSLFHNNTANSSGDYSYGGAIYYNSSATLTVTNSTFTENTATSGYYQGRGSAIYFEQGSGAANLCNVTIYGNTANGSYTGALYFYSSNDASSTLNVYNSIVCDNSGGDFYKVYVDSSVNAYSVMSSTAKWSNGTSGVIAYHSSKRLFNDAAAGDYTLAPGSQAIDKGDVAYVSTQTDLAGNPRIIGETVDLGAYESDTPAPSASLDVPIWKSASSTHDSVTVAWYPVASASGYVLEYKGENDANFAPIPQTTDTTITIPNLAPETTYKLRVYAVGDATNYSDSDFSAIKAVKTKTVPVPPSLTAPTITTTSATTNSITVKWNPVTNASGYVVEYKLATDTSYTAMSTTTDTTITIPNLVPVASYNVRVRANGDGTNYSDSPYSAVKTVKTKAESADVPSTVVTSLADTVDATDGVVTLREAITVYANDGDSVTFAPALKGGTIVLSGSQIVIDKAITVSARTLLDKTNGVPGITIDANSASRIFRITGDTVWLDSLAFTGGAGDGAGGAIYAYQSTLTISNSSFRANTGAHGGAVYADSSTLTISNVRFQNNTVEEEGLGAAINAYRSTLTISNASFRNNAAYYGGAIGAQVSTLTISNATFQNNTAAYGGAFNLSSSALFLSNSTITRNTALNASALYLTSANVRVFNATIYGNS